MPRYGMQFGASRLGSWVSLAMHCIIIPTIWQARHGTSTMLALGDSSPVRSLRLSTIFPCIAIGLILPHWLIVEAIVASGTATPQLLPVMMMTLAIIIG